MVWFNDSCCGGWLYLTFSASPFISLTGLSSGASMAMHTRMTKKVFLHLYMGNCGSGNEAGAHFPIFTMIKTYKKNQLYVRLESWIQSSASGSRMCVLCFPLCVFLLCNAMTKYPPPRHPGLTPARRVRELEKELRLMDQNLNSMVCGEEEVLTVRSPPFCSSDLQALSPFLCFLSHLHLCSMTLPM